MEGCVGSSPPAQLSAYLLLIRNEHRGLHDMKRGGKIASSKNLLLVSGDGALKRHITDALGLAGIPRTTLATATCGRDALRIVAKDRPRLLIVDNDLSDTTGLELLHALYQDGIKPLVVYMATQHTF